MKKNHASRGKRIELLFNNFSGGRIENSKMAFLMKGRIIVLMILVSMVGGLVPAHTYAQSDGTVPAPIFERVSVDNVPVERYVFDVNTTVKISYKADRFAVDGILLLGQGSNLTEDVQLAKTLNFSFTLDRKFKAFSYYSIELNVTEFTKYYAWAWSGSVTNGTREEFTTIDQDRENGNAYRYLWVKQGERYPEFDSIRNATFQEGSIKDYVTQLGETVTINYRVYDPNNKTNAVIAFSDNNTNIYNKTSSVQYNMTFVKFDKQTNYTTFAFNYTLKTRVVFFSAFNSKGWERKAQDSTAGIVHKLSSYFIFNSTLYDFDKREFTDLDKIGFNVTTYNQTNEDLVYVRYRFYDNLTDNEPTNWTDVRLFNITTPYEVNKTVNNVTVATTLVTEYRFELNQTLKFDQKVEFQPYVKNRNYTEYLNKKLFEIVDSRPSGKLFMANNSITNKTELVIFFSAKTEKGKIKDAFIFYGLNDDNLSSINIKGSENLDKKANTTLTLSTEGNYTIILNITNTLNKTRAYTVYLLVDHTTPTGTLDIIANNGTASVSLSASDSGSGVLSAYIEWGDGLVEDVTNKTSVSHQYRKSGDYDIRLIIKDKAGNIIRITQTVSITVPTSSRATNNTTPLSILAFLAMLLPIILLKKKGEK